MKNPSKYGLLSLMITALAFAGACSDDSSSDGPEDPNPSVCDENNPCIDGYLCNAGTCFLKVSLDDACGIKTICTEGSCINGTCQLSSEEQKSDLGGNCQSDKACKQGTCLNGKCTITAGANESCASTPCITGYSCITETKTCKIGAVVGQSCSAADTVCIVGECEGGVCIAKTEDDKLKSNDTDGDGISDYYDRCDVDSDDDTLPNCQDEDSDNDTIPDYVEARLTLLTPADSDDDGLYDFIDTDSDNNGIPDSAEGQCTQVLGEDGNPVLENGHPKYTCLDTDDDGLPDYIDDDNDNDAVSDTIEIVGLTLTTEAGYVPGRMCGESPCAAGTPESPWDTDGDTVPDYMDTDSDGDTVPDNEESPLDTDGDGTIDRYDLDSDNDTIPDKDEYGLVYIEDGNTTKCIVSSDCDGDGLSDGIEFHIDCTDYSVVDASGKLTSLNAHSAMLTKNTDNDGYADAAEHAAAQYAIEHCKTDHQDWCSFDDPITGLRATISRPEDLICNAGLGVNGVFDFYFELPYEGDQKDDELLFKPAVSKLDVVINLDVTGSMQNEITNVTQKLETTIIPGVQERVSDWAFAISAFADFPVSNANGTARYGAAVDREPFTKDNPWQLLSKITSSKNALNDAVKNFRLTDGYDYPESGYESLYQIAMADQMTNETQTAYYEGKDLTSPTAGKLVRMPIITNDDAHWGGVSFRNGTLPVVVHITDAPSHGSSTAKTVAATLQEYIYDANYILNAHTDADVHKAYQEHGIRLLTVYRRSATEAKENKDKEGITAGAQHPVLRNSSLETSALVPACAFKKDASNWKCGENKCCTVTTAEGSVDPIDNQCILSYGLTSGTALSDTVVDGIDALVKYGTYEVATRVRGLEMENGNNTSCFIKQVVATRYIAPAQEPEASCNPTATPAQIEIDGVTPEYNNGFINFATGTASSRVEGANLAFTVYAQNDTCAPYKAEAQTFMAYIDVINPTTGLVFGTRQVYIIVPGYSEHSQVN